jgi:hypothetical protein
VRLIKAITLFFILILSTNIQASTVDHTSTIKAIKQAENGQWALILDTDHSACPSTISPDKYYWVAVGQQSVTSDASQKMLSIALTAAMGQKTIDLTFSSSSTPCWVKTLTINF